MLPPKLAIISPCYNEEDILPDTIPTLCRLLNMLIEEKCIDKQSYIVFIDDGSLDKTYQILKENTSPQIKALKLSTNKGHQYALLAGLHFTTNKVDCVISIDADLQDDLNVIPQMIKQYENGAHIVCGVRTNRDTDTFFKRKTARIFYHFMHQMGVTLIENHADFRLLSNKALIEILKYKESNLFLRGLFPLINMRLETIEYTQKDRKKGQTKYGLRKMMSLAISGITSFSSAPIRMITGIGLLLFLVTMALSFHVLVVYVKGDVVPGWASISLPMYFLGGVQLLSLGIIGEYVAKIYKETKRRPYYHIEDILE
ncbi:glycosyltransferase family 2 protein [Mucilaginibacter sp.]|uniref:glycosyltransferase family 2 protein n=1 Tax=Mucilaginibacter sp. TaxID=1882438 RepID=UPI002ED596DA